MAKTPIFDPGSSEVRSPLLAGLSEGVSKVSDILDVEVTTNVITLRNVPITDSDKNRIYQAAFGSRLWLETPAPIIRKNGVVITEENDSFIIDYVGGSIAFDKNSRLEDDDVVTAEVTYCTNESRTIKDINTNIESLQKEFSEFTDFITGEGAPTSNTEGKIGQDYVDRTTGDKYHLVSDDGGVYVWERYQDKLSFDKEPVDGSENPVFSGGVFSALQRKPNPNLLDNSFFIGGGSQQGGGQFPINRRGEKEYTGFGYIIDRWERVNYGRSGKITLVEKGLHLVSDGGSGIVLSQKLRSGKTFSGEKATVSVLIDDFIVGNNLTVQCGTTLVVSKNGLTSATFTVPDSGLTGITMFNNSGPIDAILVAVKIELGEQQTLAHQNKNGNWILNEIPDYAEQYAICEQYNPITGNFIGKQYSNPNLLDNWYFVGGGSQQGGGQFPINQRGQSEYQERTQSYAIDRWAYNIGVKINLVEEGVKIIQVQTGGRTLLQAIDNASIYAGKTVTATFLVNELSSQMANAHLVFNINGSDRVLVGDINTPGLYASTISLPESLSSMAFKIGFSGQNGDYCIVSAAKLELGPVQTLAHKEGDQWVLNDPPPNFQQELAKCQRYFIRYNSMPRDIIVNTVQGYAANSTVAVFLAPLPTIMRASPSVITKDVVLQEFSGATHDILSLSSRQMCGNWLDVRFNSSGLPIGERLSLRFVGSCYMDLDAEL